MNTPRRSFGTLYASEPSPNLLLGVSVERRSTAHREPQVVRHATSLGRMSTPHPSAVLAEDGLDAGQPWHFGDPLREQRRLEAGDGSRRPVAPRRADRHPVPTG